MDRRKLVSLTGAVTAGALAGCFDLGAGDGRGEEPQNRATTERKGDSGLVTEPVDGETVEEAVERIKGDIEANGNLTLVTELDHAENAATVDLELPPTVLLVFGNPAAGTPMMGDSRTVGVDLPQKLLVWDDDGSTKVTYNDPTHVAQRHGIDGRDELLENIRGTLDALATGDEG